MSKYLFFSCFLICILAKLPAQENSSGSVNVKIVDASNKPVEFVNVILKKATDLSFVKGELSDSTGQCHFAKVKFGKYLIEASFIGYATVTTEAFTIDSVHSVLNLNPVILQPNVKGLKEVTVSSQVSFIERSENKTVLNVENSAVSSGSTAFDVLKRAPGVAVDKDDNIIVKGKSGIIVLMDGKQTYLSGDQLNNLLKNMPSESISKIELITNPSAKYDAAGNSLINIKTKKSKMNGLNGSVTGGVGYAQLPKFNGGLNLNYRVDKINIYGSYNYQYRESFERRSLNRIVNSDSAQLFDQNTYAERVFQNHIYKVGADYFLSKRHTVGFLINGYSSLLDRDGISRTNIGPEGESADYLLSTWTMNRDRYNSMSYNLNYAGVLDTNGMELSIDADMGTFKSNGTLKLNDNLLDIHTQKIIDANAIKNESVTDIKIKSIKSDYTLPLGKSSKAEMGVKVSSVSTSNTLLYDSLLNNVYVPSKSQSDEFNYTETIVAGYGIISKTLKKTAVQLGVRAENTSSVGKSIALDSTVKRNYLNFFPSLLISHSFDENHKIDLSYSRRIDRPAYQSLNPFLFFLDKYTYIIGNPFLKPQYTNAIEASYSFHQKYIASIGYSRTNQVILEFIEQNDKTKITTSTKKNLNNQNNYMLSFSIPVAITSWWSCSNNLSVNYSEFQIKDNTTNYTNSIVGFNLRTMHSFSLPGEFKFQISGFYNSPFVAGVFKGKEQYIVDLGLQKSFWNRRINATLNLSDIFKNNRFYGGANYNNINIAIHNRYETRIVTLTLSYRFGSNEIKLARERRAATEEEQKRIRAN